VLRCNDHILDIIIVFFFQTSALIEKGIFSRCLSSSKILKMWRPSGKTLAVEHAVEGSKKQRDDDESATSNIDSGFLSDNMQLSDEIGDSGLQQEQQQVKEDQRPAPITSTPTITNTVTSSSSTVIAEDSTRTVDSGIVDVDLSTGLSHLTLQQSNLNRLDRPGRLIHTEPTNIQLSSVNASPTANYAELQDHRNAVSGQRQQNSGEKTINEEFWQFYTQDNDGDT